MSDVTNTFYPGEAKTGYGAQLLAKVDEPNVYAAFADISEITPGDMTTETHDKTHLRSPEAHREKMAGLRDSGPFGLTGNWRPKHGSQSNAGGDGFPTGGLVALWRTRKETDFKILLPFGDPVSQTVTLAQVSGVATATSSAPHGLETGMSVDISGASPGAYNGTHLITVVTATTFTYPVAAGTTSPATGTIAVTTTTDIEWPFRGVVTKFQPGTIGLDDKIPFTAEVTPLSDFSAALP